MKQKQKHIHIFFYILVLVCLRICEQCVYLYIYDLYIHIYIYIYIYSLYSFWSESMVSRYSIVIWFLMDLRPLCADTLPTRIDVDVFEDYDRLLTMNAIAMHGPLAAVPLPMPVFEAGLFIVVHAHGLLMNSDWIRGEGSPLGYLQFGERFAVLDVSMHEEAGLVRALVENWDGVWGYISVYNMRCMQHFVVSMDGKPEGLRPRDLLRGLIDALCVPRPPLCS